MRTEPLFDPPAVEALRRAQSALQEALTHAEDDDESAALAALSVLTAAKAALAVAETEVARRARARGASWRDLAAATGATRQGVTRRYRSRGVR